MRHKSKCVHGRQLECMWVEKQQQNTIVNMFIRLSNMFLFAAIGVFSVYALRDKENQKEQAASKTNGEEEEEEQHFQLRSEASEETRHHERDFLRKRQRQAQNNLDPGCGCTLQ